MRNAVLIASLILSSSSAIAQQKLTVNLAGANGQLTVSEAGTGIATENVVGQGGATIEITCPTDATCTTVSASVGTSQLALSGTNPRTVTIPASMIQSPKTLLIQASGRELGRYTLRASASSSGDSASSGTAATTDDPVALLAAPCTVQVTSTVSDPNEVNFFVSPRASILERVGGSVDEDDAVIVHVVGAEALLPFVEVRRVSPTRVTGDLAIMAAGSGQIKLSRQSATTVKCMTRKFELGDFEPGEGKFEVLLHAAAEPVTLGSFTFTVNPTYRGILSFGPLWTDVADRSYALAPKGTDKKIIVGNAVGDEELLYAVMYTHFVRGARDPEEKSGRAASRINPTIGFAVDDIADHGLLGLSFDFDYVLITAGLHAGRVTRLSEASGLKEGSEFTGAVTDIPLQKKWETGAYAGMTVDLRAAGAALKSILGN